MSHSPFNAGNVTVGVSAWLQFHAQQNKHLLSV